MAGWRGLSGTLLAAVTAAACASSPTATATPTRIDRVLNPRG